MERGAGGTGLDWTGQVDTTTISFKPSPPLPVASFATPRSQQLPTEAASSLHHSSNLDSIVCRFRILHDETIDPFVSASTTYHYAFTSLKLLLDRPSFSPASLQCRHAKLPVNSTRRCLFLDHFRPHLRFPLRIDEALWPPILCRRRPYRSYPTHHVR